MISEAKLQEWEQQNQKDIQQYKKDEAYLKSLQTSEDKKLRSYFQRLRSKYFNFRTQEHQKLNRLLAYTEIQSQLQHYPKIMKAYLTYHTSSLLLLGACVMAPKKYLTKLILSLIVYGLKLNIGDGIFNYYMIESMALGNRMTEKEQQTRNVLEFYYLRNQFNRKAMTQEQQKQGQEILEKIRKQNHKYEEFKKVQQLM